MRVVVTGSHGLIGRALVEALLARGDDVTRLVRSPTPGPGDARWDVEAGTIEAAALEGHDAVVHLAGEGIGDHRWNEEHKRAVRESRIKGTTLLTETLAKLDRPPRVLASGSAVGFYGDRGDTELEETSGPGSGFLAELVVDWEAATQAAAGAGMRVALLRTGIVLSPVGGSLKQLLLPFRLGLGGRIGSGHQYMSWISIDDEVAAILRVIDDDTLRGPVNLTAPTPVTNATFTKAVGRVLRRPTLLPVPLPALSLLYGREFVDEALLASQRVVPHALEGAGFEFRHRDLESALRDLLGR